MFNNARKWGKFGISFAFLDDFFLPMLWGQAQTFCYLGQPFTTADWKLLQPGR